MWITFKRYADRTPNRFDICSAAGYGLISHQSLLSLLSQKISEENYKSFEEFRADAQLIVHNTAILHGGERV